MTAGIFAVRILRPVIDRTVDKIAILICLSRISDHRIAVLICLSRVGDNRIAVFVRLSRIDKHGIAVFIRLPLKDGLALIRLFRRIGLFFPIFCSLIRNIAVCCQSTSSGRLSFPVHSAVLGNPGADLFYPFRRRIIFISK